MSGRPLIVCTMVYMLFFWACHFTKLQGVMQIYSSAFTDGGPIPEELAFARMDPAHRFALAGNRSPDLVWTGVPEGTKSFVLICHDPDVPGRPRDVNRDDRTVPPDLDRVDFFHWVLVDLPGSCSGLEIGADSDGVTPGGKDQAPGPFGSRRGLNNFTDWFKGDERMEGQYFGYDGPAPPWNDSIKHRYVFTLYALDIERCAVDGAFGGDDVLTVIESHILDQASLTGTYSLNPDLAA